MLVNFCSLSVKASNKQVEHDKINPITKVFTKNIMSDLFLIYEIEGATKVPQIQGDKACDSIRINFDEEIDDCDEDFSYFGYFYDKKITYDDFKSKKIKDTVSFKENANRLYETILSKDYFNNTSELAKEFEEVKNKYEEYLKTRHIIKDNDPIALKFRNFKENHPIINNKLDPRFNGFFVDEEINDPSRPDVKMVTHFYDFHPEINYEDYCEFIKYYFPIYLEVNISEQEGEINWIENEFKIVVKSIKNLLKDHDRVGLVCLATDATLRYIDREKGSINDFTINDYLKFHCRIIYRFTK